MPYALRSTVNSDELEIAEILMSLSKPATRSSYDSDSDSEYVPDADDEMDVVSVSDDDDEEYVPVDADEEYVPADDDEEYVPADADEEYVPADDDEEYVPADADEDAADADEEYVPADADEDADDDDEEYVPADDDEDADGDDEEVADVDEDSDEIRKAIVRQACSSISRGIAIPRPFWRLISLTKNNRVSVQFKKWMLGIPPVKSIYASFASLH